MVDKSRIREGVVNMLRVNLGLEPGERLLVMSDIPLREDWLALDSSKLDEQLDRCVLTKAVEEIASESFPDVESEFYPFPSTGKSGTEPSPEVARRMREVDVIVALTTHSLSHTDAREHSTEAGARAASMPGFLQDMFYPDGPMTADYEDVASEATQLADRMTGVELVEVTSEGGTDMRFSLEERRAKPDTGLYRERGKWGNLPAGEAYVAPVEGTAEGRIVVEVGWFPALKQEMSIDFENGVVVKVKGGGEVGDRYRNLLKPERNTEPYLSRRNLAELGVGVNPKARRTDNVLEAEKIRGTVHLAVGSNIHFGGKVKADLHTDFVIPKPSLILDGSAVMREGNLSL